MKNQRPSIAEKKNDILHVLLSEKILKSKESLTAPSSFIIPYDPRDEHSACEVRQDLIVSLKARGHKVCDVDLYHLYIKLLDATDSFEDVAEVESEYSHDVFIDMLNDIVDAENDIVPAIDKSLGESELLFISGVGACYPFLRIHRLLEILHPHVPIIVFFPGDYYMKNGCPCFDVLDIPQEGNTPHYRARSLYDFL